MSLSPPLPGKGLLSFIREMALLCSSSKSFLLKMENKDVFCGLPPGLGPPQPQVALAWPLPLLSGGAGLLGPPQSPASDQGRERGPRLPCAPALPKRPCPEGPPTPGLSPQGAAVCDHGQE